MYIASSEEAGFINFLFCLALVASEEMCCYSKARAARSKAKKMQLIFFWPKNLYPTISSRYYPEVMC